MTFCSKQRVLKTTEIPKNNLQFTISISPKLWNNSMGFQCWPTHKNITKKAIRFISNAKYNNTYHSNVQGSSSTTGSGHFQVSLHQFFFYKCENRIIPDYFNNMILTHEHTKRLQRIRWAPQHFNKMETNLPNYNNYEIKVKHTNSKYCRFCIRHEIPKLIKDNYLPGKVLEKINTHSYSGFVHYAQNYIISEYESMCCIRNCYIGHAMIEYIFELTRNETFN